ncbi:MAG: hypothetical protein ACRD4H_00565 [Candidatus Acidiferrales bacterium]
MSYEVFERKATRFTSPAITLTRFGKILPNAMAARKFKEHAVEQVLLLWDKGQRKIAVRAATKGDRRSFKVSYTRKYGASISGASFLKSIDWRETKRVTFPATWNEDEHMFEFSLTNKMGKRSAHR